MPISEVLPSKRVGIIVPSSNTTVEAFTSSILASLPTTQIVPIFTRIRVKTLDASPATVAQFDASILETAAKLLADANPQFVIWAGTSAQFLPDSTVNSDLQFAGRTSLAASVPFSTNTLAMLAALNHLNIKDISIAVPYSDALTAKVVAFWKQAGYLVHAAVNFHAPDNIAIGKTSEKNIISTIKSSMTPATKAVIVPCTNWPAAPLVEKLEEELGVYVLDSVVINTWFAVSQIMETVGERIDEQPQGYGKLWQTLATG